MYQALSYWCMRQSTCELFELLERDSAVVIDIGLIKNRLNVVNEFLRRNGRAVSERVDVLRSKHLQIHTNSLRPPALVA